MSEDDFGEALTGVALVIDAREAQVVVRRLAQNLKEPILRRLRGYTPGADIVEKGPNLVTIHQAGQVDFGPTWTITSLIGPCDRFISSL